MSDYREGLPRWFGLVLAALLAAVCALLVIPPAEAAARSTAKPALILPTSNYDNASKHAPMRALPRMSAERDGVRSAGATFEIAQFSSRTSSVVAAEAAPRVAIDSGTARALASADRSVANRLESQFAGCDLIMCRTAADEFTGAVARLAGPSEKAAADALMHRVTVVADNPSLRAAGLRPTGNLGANDIQIFGTADQMGIPIFTSDARALRAAWAQGVDFDAFLHPPISFLGY